MTASAQPTGLILRDLLPSDLSPVLPSDAAAWRPGISRIASTNTDPDLRDGSCAHCGEDRNSGSHAWCPGAPDFVGYCNVCGEHPADHAGYRCGPATGETTLSGDDR